MYFMYACVNRMCVCVCFYVTVCEKVFYGIFFVLFCSFFSLFFVVVLLFLAVKF